MSENFRNLENILEDLNKSKDEDQIIEILTKIVKGFHINLYKDKIITNPYFKSLIQDVKVSVQSEIQKIRQMIEDEIQAIDLEIEKPKCEYIDKLKDLKRECISLIYEIDQKEKDLKLL